MLQVFDGPSIEFKLGTGVEVNRSYHLNQLSQVQLRKTVVRLKPFLYPVSNECIKDEFFVVKGKSEVLLGVHVCIKCKLATINVPRSQIPHSSSV